MSGKQILGKEAFIRAWIENGKSKTWNDFAVKMNAACIKAGAAPLNAANNYKELHLRCEKIQDTAFKNGFTGKWPRPSRPTAKAEPTIAEILAANPDLQPTG